MNELHAFEAMHDRTCGVNGEIADISIDGDFDSIIGPGDIVITEDVTPDDDDFDPGVVTVGRIRSRRLRWPWRRRIRV